MCEMMIVARVRTQDGSGIDDSQIYCSAWAARVQADSSVTAQADGGSKMPSSQLD